MLDPRYSAVQVEPSPVEPPPEDMDQDDRHGTPENHCQDDPRLARPIQEGVDEPITHTLAVGLKQSVGTSAETQSSS